MVDSPDRPAGDADVLDGLAERVGRPLLGEFVLDDRRCLGVGVVVEQSKDGGQVQLSRAGDVFDLRVRSVLEMGGNDPVAELADHVLGGDRFDEEVAGVDTEAEPGVVVAREHLADVGHRGEDVREVVVVDRGVVVDSDVDAEFDGEVGQFLGDRVGGGRVVDGDVVGAEAIGEGDVVAGCRGTVEVDDAVATDRDAGLVERVEARGDRRVVVVGREVVPPEFEVCHVRRRQFVEQVREREVPEDDALDADGEVASHAVADGQGAQKRLVGRRLSLALAAATGRGTPFRCQRAYPGRGRLRSMDVCLIGGTGLISTGIARQAVAAGHDVTAFHRGETDADLPEDVTHVYGDRNDEADLERVAEEVDPDVVVDMVCFDPEQAEQAVAAFSGVEQYVFCSTVDVYHRPLDANPATEDAPRDPPVSDYGENKAACEDIFMDADGDAFRTTVIRPWSTYGEGGPVIHTMGWGTYYLDRIREGKPVIVHGDGATLWGPCHRDDVAGAFVGALGNAEAYGEAYHVTTEEVISWNQYHEYVADAMDAPDPELVSIPTEQLVAVAPDRTDPLLDHFQFSTVFDNSKARRDLGFEYTVSFREGVERTIDWLETNDEIDDWDSENDDEIIAAWREATDDFADAVGE